MNAPHTIHVIYIRAAPERVWEAITSRAKSKSFFYETDIELRIGGAFRLLGDDGAPVVSGEVLALQPQQVLRVSWLELSDPAHPPGAVEYRLEDAGVGLTKLTVSNFDDPSLSAEDMEIGRSGWGFTLSNLKSLLETGEALPAPNV